MMGKDFENPWGLKTKKGDLKKMSMLLNSAVFPGNQGGPLEHVIAAKAVGFGENLLPSWKEYATQVKKNAAVLAEDLIGYGFDIVSGGTDNHSMLLDLRPKYPELTGKVAEAALVAADITANKNAVPYDERSAFQTSGLRLGTAAMTTRGAKVLIVLLMLPDEATSQRRRRGMIASNTAQTDSLQGNDSLRADTVTVRIDSIAPVKKKQPLDAPVVYESNDSTVFTLGGAATLYGSGKVNYQNIELAAEVISMNLDSSTVHAYGIKDTTGVEKGKPVFKEGDTSYDTETIRYNFKTKKAGITDIVTQQGEGYVTGSKAKKGANDEIFMEHGRYTTCDHHDHPHFYMQLTRAKVRPKKNVVTGPAYLVVEDVPLPLAVPFFFFPFSSSYSSGFIMPTYDWRFQDGYDERCR